MRRAGPTLAAAVVLLAVTAVPAAAGEAVDTHSTVAPNQKAIDLIAQRTSDARQSEDHPSDGPLLREQVHGLICKGAIGGLATPLNGSCSEVDAFTLDIDCGGDTPVRPLFSRVRTSESEPWSEWMPETIGGCPADVLPVLTVEDFRRLPLAPPVLTLQPDRGWVLVNKETIVMTDRTEQAFRTELLGHGIDVIATPGTFTYDFGDDTKDLVTRSAGHSWPDHDTFHVYEELGTVQITLTTTWTGRYRIDGTTQWRDVVGTAETSATSAPFIVEERRSRLVSGLCTNVPRPDDCD